MTYIMLNIDAVRRFRRLAKRRADLLDRINADDQSRPSITRKRIGQFRSVNNRLECLMIDHGNDVPANLYETESIHLVA